MNVEIREAPLAGWGIVPVGGKWMLGKLNVVQKDGDTMAYLLPVYDYRVFDAVPHGSLSGIPVTMRIVCPPLNYPELTRVAFDVPLNTSVIDVEQLSMQNRQALAELVAKCEENMQGGGRVSLVSVRR